VQSLTELGGGVATGSTSPPRWCPTHSSSPAFAFVYAFLRTPAGVSGSALVGRWSPGVLWQSASWGFARFRGELGPVHGDLPRLRSRVALHVWALRRLARAAGRPRASPSTTSTRSTCGRNGGEASPTPRPEELALALMALVARAQYQPEIPTTTDALARAPRFPMAPVQATLEALEAAVFLAQTGDPAGAGSPPGPRGDPARERPRRRPRRDGARRAAPRGPPAGGPDQPPERTPPGPRRAHGRDLRGPGATRARGG